MSSSASSLGPTMHHFGGASWSYSTAFPPLQSFPWNIPHTKRSSHQATPSSSLQHSLAPPKYPTYLKQTLYADLAVEQYNYFQSRRSFFPTERQCSNSTNSSLTSSFGRSHTNAPATNSYYAELENLDLRLPTCWNQKDKSRFIEIGRNALDLSYTGPGKSEADAASVRANFPMRPQCGIYYFEMHVLSKGNDGYIGIGFCGADNKLERLPGWDVGSWGYHGDDGNAFAGSGTGRRYGPCFTTGDVIGCGVNFAESSAFYTKNGTLLGDAFNDVPCDAELYPCIGLRTPGERVTVNFGQESFVFDIAQYIKDYKNKVWRDIAENRLPCTNTARATSQTKIKAHHQLNELILSYLVHHGYMSTAKAVVRDSTRLCDKEISLENAELRLYGQNDQDAEKDMLNRQNIRKAIIAGDIDSAINLTNELFPGLLDGPEVGKDALFELKCQKFVEMVRDYGDREQAKRDTEISDEDHCSVNSGRLSIFRDDDHDADEIANYNTNRRRSVGSGCATTPSMHVPGANRQRRLSYAAIAASASPNNNCNGFLAFSASPTAVDNHFDQDDEHVSHSGFGRRHRRASMRRSSTCSSLFSASSNNVPPSHETTVEETLFNEDLEEDSTTGLMKKIMKYGQQLQDEYRNDERPKIRSRLVEIFSLLAYHDVYESPVAHLLDKSCRDDLATTLNTAILAYQKRPQMPPLERMYRQAVLTNKELVLAGHGKAAVINIKEHCCKDVARKDTLSPA